MKYDNELVTAASKYLLSQGIRVLQGNRFAQTERKHLEKLVDCMKLNGEKEVADMGCGFGEVSRAMSQVMPETHFWLVNCNEFQLTQCPLGPRFSTRQEDICSTSIPTDSIDLVLFNYSICHVDPDAALAEAARITRRGGRLFVYDYQRLRGDDTLTEKHLQARFMRDLEFRTRALVAGWHNIETLDASGDDTLFQIAFNDPALYRSMFEELRPVIWRAARV